MCYTFYFYQSMWEHEETGSEGTALSTDHSGHQKSTASCFSGKVSFVNDRKI